MRWLKRAEVKHDGDKNVSQSLFVQRQRKMMVVDDVVALFRTQHDRYHVMADERADLLRFLLSQAFAFFFDLPHANRDLGGTQAFNRDGLQNGLALVSHGYLPSMAKLGLQIMIGPSARARQSGQ